MTKKNTIKVATEYGTFQRQTARPYSHFVISTGESAAHIEDRYAKDRMSSERYAAKYDAIVVAMDKAGKPFCKQYSGDSYNDAQFLRNRNLPKGHLEFADTKPEEIGFWSRSEWLEYADGCREHVETSYARCAKEIEKQKEIGYRDIQWSSRLDLARKYADQLREYGHTDIRIIEIATGKEVR